MTVARSPSEAESFEGIICDSPNRCRSVATNQNDEPNALEGENADDGVAGGGAVCVRDGDLDGVRVRDGDFDRVPVRDGDFDRVGDGDRDRVLSGQVMRTGAGIATVTRLAGLVTVMRAVLPVPKYPFENLHSSRTTVPSAVEDPIQVGSAPTAAVGPALFQKSQPAAAKCPWRMQSAATEKLQE